MQKTKLRNANLTRANLRRANIYDADLSNAKLENANLSFTNNDSNQIYTRGTIGVSSGKYYWEAKQGSGTAWAIRLP